VEQAIVVLVVEDDSVVQVLVEDTLTDGGFEVVAASSVEQAVERLGELPFKYRALVTDINLGDEKLNGWDIARRARELTPDLPVVYVTGDSAKEWAAQGVPNSLLLPKPFAPAQLLTAVSQLLNAGSPPTPPA
jgi:CheY-like chemotaxis protein